MTLPRDWLNELQGLLDCLLDGDLTEQDRLRLNALLRAGTEAQDFFITYTGISSGLMWDGQLASETLRPSLGGTNVVPSGAPVDAPSFTTPLESGVVADSLVPFALTRSPLFPPSINLRHSLLAGAPLCYAVAVLMMGVGMLAAWMWETPSNRPAATISRAIPQPVRQSAPHKDRQQRQSVGKITRMSGSKWRDEKIAEEAKEVPVGGEYLLTSGMLEITYNTGAKVVLEGRTRYIVDSPSSGLLLVGKLTVKTEAKAENGRPKFAIRTPTTAITERGAEFGIWVSQSKVTYATVVRGNVECQLLGERNTILSFGKGDWACVTLRADGGRDVIYGKAGDKPPAVLADQLHETPPIFSSDDIRDGQQPNPAPESKNKKPRQSGSPDS
jgi:hypothetical protein